MNRTRVTGLLLSFLGAAAGCDDDDFVCTLDVCGTGCVNLQADNNNCGACFNECGTGTACMAGTCEPTELVCEAPTPNACGDNCTDVMTDEANCGSCGTACSQFSECLDGNCAGPLVALRTVETGKGDVLRDAYVVDDLLGVVRLGDDTAASTFFERVSDLKVMPDGHVLLVAAQETEGIDELWLSSPKGGALVKLNATLEQDEEVLDGVAVSADSSKVLFRTIREGGQIELFVVSIANPGVVAKVNGTLADGGTVEPVFALTADGSKAFYLAEQDSLATELFVVDLTGATPGASVKLNATLDLDARIIDFVMLPDGSRVVYREDIGGGGNPLFFVEVATTTVEPILNTTVGDYTAEDDYQFVGTDAVLYRSELTAFDESIYTVSLLGPAFDSTLVVENVNGQINGEIRGPMVVVDGFVYYRQHDPADVEGPPNTLFRAALDGATGPELVLEAGSRDLDVDRLAVSPDGTHMLFGAGGDGAEGGVINPGVDGGPFLGFSTELYHLDLTAALPFTPVRIVDDQSKGTQEIEGDYFVKNDGRIVLRGDLQTNNVIDVFLAVGTVADTVVKIGPVLDETTQSNTVRDIQAF